MKTNALISAMASLLMLASCAGGGNILTDVYEDSATVPVAEGSPNEMSVSVTIEYPAGGVPAEAADRMTSAILKEALGADTGDGHHRGGGGDGGGGRGWGGRRWREACFPISS